MDPFAQTNTSKKKSSAQQNSSFANALAEHERPLGSSPATPSQSNPNALFSEAMARAGGQLDSAYDTSGSNNTEGNSTNQFAQGLADQENQKRLLEEKKREEEKRALRKKLHDQINPVETYDIFSAKQEKVQKDLEETRKEIKELAKEISKLHRDLDIAASQTIVEPGDDGVYYISFLQKLRNFIMLLRQKVKSARTWAQQAQAKSNKKKKKKTPGLEMGGEKHEQSKAIFDMMHHEQSNNYSGS
jgi:vancomycin resistance protein YoaR